MMAEREAPRHLGILVDRPPRALAAVAEMTVKAAILNTARTRTSCGGSFLGLADGPAPSSVLSGCRGVAGIPVEVDTGLESERSRSSAGSSSTRKSTAA